MATQITCIVPDSSATPNRRIDAVGGPGGWRKDEDQVIDEIEAGAEYFVEVEEEKAKVVVESNGTLKFLKTEADGFVPNNLMALPTCED